MNANDKQTMRPSEFHLPADTLHEKIVFCDFDGTITKEETFVAILKEFSPLLAEEIIPQMYDRKISLRDGVRRILEDIPSSKVPEIIEFVHGKEIRKGFIQLLEFLKTHGIPLVIVSGGLIEVVKIVLGDIASRVENIYAVELDVSNPYVKVISPYEDDSELVSKPRIMSLYNAKERVAIGDSLTDLNMSLEADIVFARGRLAEYLTQKGKSFYEWHNFVDVMNQLKTYWGFYDRKDRR